MEDQLPDEPLETFYGGEDDDDDAQRLAEASNAEASGRPVHESGGARKRTVTGALMVGIAMGLREVFEPERLDRIAIEQPAPEQPLEPQKYEVHLDPDAPESSFAIYRPWVDGEIADVGDVHDEHEPERARSDGLLKPRDGRAPSGDGTPGDGAPGGRAPRPTGGGGFGALGG